MKVCILLSLVFAVAHGAPFKSYGMQCARQTGISKDALKLIAQETTPSSDDEAYKNFIFCLLKKLGILTDEGELRTDTEGLEEWMPADEARKNLEDIRSDCGDQKGKTRVDTADLIYRCILANDL